jgi:hypothetical protein
METDQMAIDLVPNNRDCKIEGWDYLSPEENANIVIANISPEGKAVFCKRSDLHLPENVFTLTNQQWEPFWDWVCLSNGKKGGIFSTKELLSGRTSSGLQVSSMQCALLAVDLEAAILTNTPIRAADRPARTVSFIEEGDIKRPVVGWQGEFPIVEREGVQVVAAELNPRTGEPTVPTVIQEVVPEVVTTNEHGAQIVRDTIGGDWYYWSLPPFIAAPLLEFLKRCNGFTIL